MNALEFDLLGLDDCLPELGTELITFLGAQVPQAEPSLWPEGQGIFEAPLSDEVPFAFGSSSSKPFYYDQSPMDEHGLFVDSLRTWDPRLHESYPPISPSSSPPDSILETPSSVSSNPHGLPGNHSGAVPCSESLEESEARLQSLGGWSEVYVESQFGEPKSEYAPIHGFKAHLFGSELAGEFLQNPDQENTQCKPCTTVSPEQLHGSWSNPLPISQEMDIDASSDEECSDGESTYGFYTRTANDFVTHIEEVDTPDSTTSPLREVTPSPQKETRAIKAVPKRSPGVLSTQQHPLPLPTPPTARTSRGTLRPASYQEPELDVSEYEDDAAEDYGSDDSDDEAPKSSVRKRKTLRESVASPSTKKRRSLSGDDRPQCRYCGTSKSRPHDVKRHEASCDKNPNFTKEAHKCWICLDTFSRRDAAYRHITNTKKFPTCNRGYIAEGWMDDSKRSKPRPSTVLSKVDPRHDS